MEYKKLRRKSLLEDTNSKAGSGSSSYLGGDIKPWSALHVIVSPSPLYRYSPARRASERTWPNYVTPRDNPLNKELLHVRAASSPT